MCCVSITSSVNLLKQGCDVFILLLFFFFSFLNTAVCRIHDDEVKYLFEAKINNCDMTMVKQSRLGFGAVYHQTTERLFFLRL